MPRLGALARRDPLLLMGWSRSRRHASLTSSRCAPATGGGGSGRANRATYVQLPATKPLKAAIASAGAEGRGAPGGARRRRGRPSAAGAVECFQQRFQAHAAGPIAAHAAVAPRRFRCYKNYAAGVAPVEVKNHEASRRAPGRAESQLRDLLGSAGRLALAREDQCRVKRAETKQRITPRPNTRGPIFAQLRHRSPFATAAARG